MRSGKRFGASLFATVFVSVFVLAIVYRLWLEPPPTTQGNEFVRKSGLDGSVKQVREHITGSLDQGMSYQGEGWGPLLETRNGFQIEHRYTLTNQKGEKETRWEVYRLMPDGEIKEVQSRVGNTDLARQSGKNL